MDDLDKEIQRQGKELVASLEHLLSLIGDYSNPRMYRCSVCKRKLSNHRENTFCKYREHFNKG
jgi:hypothetical protein